MIAYFSPNMKRYQKYSYVINRKRDEVLLPSSLQIFKGGVRLSR